MSSKAAAATQVACRQHTVSGPQGLVTCSFRQRQRIEGVLTCHDLYFLQPGLSRASSPSSNTSVDAAQHADSIMCSQ